ncbi:hypothetical protein GN956_G17382 [Arapaima gigas]
MLFRGTKTTLERPHTHRSLVLTSHTWQKSHSPGNEDHNKPIKFSTSKASHRTWKVEDSLGSRYQRPWWKVLPISLVGIAFLLWCFFREESEIDQQLKKQLYEHLPGFVSEDDEGKEAEEVNS